MALNEIEHHPYLNYFVEHHHEKVPWEKYTKMIIGSFPIYDITETVFPLNEQRHLSPDVSMPFFYGSELNNFWGMLANVFGHNNPLLSNTPAQRKQNAIDILEDENILLTDVILNTNRFDNNSANPNSPNDSALFNLSAEQPIINQFSLNEDIIEWLSLATNIGCIYFTAQGTTGKTPGGWFNLLLNMAGVHYEAFDQHANAVKYRMNIGGKVRVIKIFFLPTPSSSRGIAFTKTTRHTMFNNYLISHYEQFHNELQANSFVYDKVQRHQLGIYRKTFVRLWWDQYLINKNVHFNGTRCMD